MFPSYHPNQAPPIATRCCPSRTCSLVIDPTRRPHCKQVLLEYQLRATESLDLLDEVTHPNPNPNPNPNPDPNPSLNPDPNPEQVGDGGGEALAARDAQGPRPEA